jgi:hypothetical protein
MKTTARLLFVLFFQEDDALGIWHPKNRRNNLQSAAPETKPSYSVIASKDEQIPSK